MPIFDGDIDNR